MSKVFGQYYGDSSGAYSSPHLCIDEAFLPVLQQNGLKMVKAAILDSTRMSKIVMCGALRSLDTYNLFLF